MSLDPVSAISGAVGIASGVAGFFGEDGSDQYGEASANAQIAGEAQQKLIDIGEKQWAIEQPYFNHYWKTYDRYLELFRPYAARMIQLADKEQQRRDPVNARLFEMAAEGVAPDYEGIENLAGEAREDVDREYDIAQGAQERHLGRRGVNPTEGSYQESLRLSELDRARTKAGAVTRANLTQARLRAGERKYADNATWARRLSIGRHPTPGSPPSPANTGPNNIAAAAQGLSGTANAQAGIGDAYAAGSTGALETAGRALASVFPPASPTTPAPASSYGLTYLT